MRSNHKLNRSKSLNNFKDLNLSYSINNSKNSSLSKSNSFSKSFIKSTVYCFDKQSKTKNEKKLNTIKKNIVLNKKDKENENLNTSISTKDSSFDSVSKKNTTHKNTTHKNATTKVNFDFSKKNFCNYIPKKDEFSKMAARIPLHFPCESYQGVNQAHNEIGDKNFLNLKEENIFNSNNDSFKIIDKKDHILINHLCQKTLNKKIINSFTIKYRLKNTTFLYFN